MSSDNTQGSGFYDLDFTWHADFDIVEYFVFRIYRLIISPLSLLIYHHPLLIASTPCLLNPSP